MRLASRHLVVAFLGLAVVVSGGPGGGSVASRVIAEEKAKDKPDEKQSETKVRELFDGRTLGQWKIADKFDFERHGAVLVVDGAVLLKKGTPATGIYYGKPDEVLRNHYELTLQAKRVEGSDFFCGLTFPFHDTYCTWIIGGWGGGVVGLSNIDNMSAVENATTDFVDFKQDQWYDIRLRVTPERLQGWIGDTQYFDVETEGRKFSIWWEQEPMRPLGIASWNTTAAIRKIRLRPLQSDAGEGKEKGERGEEKGERGEEKGERGEEKGERGEEKGEAGIEG